MSFTVALPVRDRRSAHDFYRRALALETVGSEIADDGLPEPLQFALGPGVTLMLIPRDGFGFVSADHEVAPHGVSECLLSVGVATPAEVDTVTERARSAGATIKVEPGDPGWGYQCTFTDPDDHLWMTIVV